MAAFDASGLTFGYLDEIKSNKELFHNVSKFYLSLITDWRWVARRVETAHIIDESTLRRTVSLDIQQEELDRRLVEFGVDRLKQVPLPLAFMEKGLLLDFSVTDADGHVLSLMNKSENVSLAVMAINQYLSDNVLQQLDDLWADLFCSDRMILAQTHLFGKVPDWYVFEKWRNCGEPVDICDILAGTFELSSGVEAIEDPDSQTYEADCDIYEYLFWAVTQSEQGAAELFELLMMYFPANIWYNTEKHAPTLVKYAVQESFQFSNRDDEEPLRIMQTLSQTAKISFPDFYTNCNEHLRVQVPSGTFLGRSVLNPGFIGPEDIADYSYEVHRGYTRHSYKMSHNSLSLRGRICRSLDIRILPSPEDIMASSFYWCLGILIIVVLGAVGELSPLNILSDFQASNSVGSAITILLLVPSIGLAYILRSGENSVRKGLLYSTRLWIVALMGVVVFGSVTLMLFPDVNGEQKQLPFVGNKTALLICWSLLAGVTIAIFRRTLRARKLLIYENNLALSSSNKFKVDIPDKISADPRRANLVVVRSLFFKYCRIWLAKATFGFFLCCCVLWLYGAVRLYYYDGSFHFVEGIASLVSLVYVPGSSTDLFWKILVPFHRYSWYYFLLFGATMMLASVPVSILCYFENFCVYIINFFADISDKARKVTRPKVSIPKV